MFRANPSRMNRMKMRFFAAIILLLFAAGFFAVLHIGMGRTDLTTGTVIKALLHHQEVEDGHRHIVWNLRLPRALIALVAGMMLGMAGAILQTVTRNPLVEPGLIGASAGSVLFAVLWLTFVDRYVAAPSAAWLPSAALIGGVFAVLAVYALNRKRQDGAAGLALTGVLMTAVLSACTSLILLYNQQGLATVFLWTFGSLNGRVWTHWNLLWPWAAILIPLAMGYARRAGLLQLGDDTAVGIGLAVNRTRFILMLIAAAMSAASVSAVGAISFVGLIGPHIAGLLVGKRPVYLFPVSALFSGALLMFADWTGQSITIKLPLPGMENHMSSLPVGAVTALMGAPFFMYLLRRTFHRSAGGR